MINDQKVKFVDSSTLLKGKEVKELDINKQNKVIWQQMPLRYFLDFLHNQQLFFKQLSEYGDCNERKLKYYKDCYIYNNDSKKDIIEKFLEDFEKIVYISCWWYKDCNLNDLAFGEYAGDDGVAIGVEIEKMKKILNDHSITGLDSKEEVFGGEIIYEKSSKTRIFDEHEAIGPIFMKACNKESDNEFRLI